jgi:chorismate dehydratase
VSSRTPQTLRLGAVTYLNARPLVFDLDKSSRFAVGYDLPSECARRLHAGDIDVGLIPSIEYLRGDAYRIVPDVAIASRGPVASVALFTTRPISSVRTIAMDTSSRTSVALVRVLCSRLFQIQPAIELRPPDLQAMLERADAALVIGDNALLWEPGKGRLNAEDQSGDGPRQSSVEKIDLGEAWTRMTGLPFVWAFWAGRQAVLTAEDVRALQKARDAGVAQPDAIACEYFRDEPERQAAGARYLRDNIKYHLGGDERAALEAFYRYAVEAGVVSDANELRFY